jgi:hypothetical protein
MKYKNVDFQWYQHKPVSGIITFIDRAKQFLVIEIAVIVKVCILQIFYIILFINLYIYF